MKSYSFLISIVCIFLFLAFALFGHYDSDDFYLYKVFNNDGIWQYQFTSYLNWDGRSISVPVFIQSFFLKHFSPKLNVLAWLILFIACVYLVLTITANVYSVKDLIRKEKLPFFVIWLFVFWIGNYTNLADTVYWCTGGVYTIRLFLILLWMSIFIKSKNNPARIKNFTLLTILTFFVAQSSVQIGIAMLVFLAVSYIDNKQFKISYFVLIVSALGGILITALTPGNLNRASVSPHGLEIELFSVFKNAIKIYFKFLVYGALLFLLVCYFSLKISGNTFNSFIKDQLRKRSMQQFLVDYQFAIMAVVSVIPIVVLPDFAGHRPSIYFLWFMAIHIMLGINKISNVKNKSKGSWQLVMVSVFTLFLMVQFALNYQFHSEVLKRENYLYSYSNEKNFPEIAPVDISVIPFTYKHNDVISIVFAKHYGHNKVLYKKNKQKPEYFRTHLNRKFQLIKASLKD